MASQAWRPNAELAAIKARSQLYTDLRAFFNGQGYLEVSTPALSAHGTVDLHIDSIWAEAAGRVLHTSPEFAMKRLLAAYAVPIYQICAVYRPGEKGRLHNPEFTMLEWYRPGFDHHQLMTEMDALLGCLGVLKGDQVSTRLSYVEAFQQYLNIDVRQITLQDCLSVIDEQGIQLASTLADVDEALDLLMSACIGPRLGVECPCYLFDYPATQASLACVREDEWPVAERFELYWQGVELANGFHELTDAAEQRKRFDSDVARRQAMGKRTPRKDENLLAAMEAGLPDSAGVALGVDRLLMLLMGKAQISEVLSFDWERC